MNIKIPALILSAISLSACHETEVHHEVYEEETHYYEAPEVLSFNMIDSYEVNSEFDSDPLFLSPYLAGGIFEIFWEVDARYAHRVELFINDVPNPDFGIKLSSSWCGRGESCSNTSYQFCHYSADLSITCELPESYSHYYEKDVSVLFENIPEDLYFVMEVCDESLFYCEYSSLPVTLE